MNTSVAGVGADDSSARRPVGRAIDNRPYGRTRDARPYSLFGRVVVQSIRMANKAFALHAIGFNLIQQGVHGADALHDFRGHVVATLRIDAEQRIGRGFQRLREGKQGFDAGFSGTALDVPVEGGGDIGHEGDACLRSLEAFSLHSGSLP